LRYQQGSIPFWGSSLESISLLFPASVAHVIYFFHLSDPSVATPPSDQSGNTPHFYGPMWFNRAHTGNLGQSRHLGVLTFNHPCKVLSPGKVINSQVLGSEGVDLLRFVMLLSTPCLKLLCIVQGLHSMLTEEWISYTSANNDS
jgi:hypothetical protein